MTGAEPVVDWARIYAHPPAGSPALFMDRDGTIIENSPYLSDPDGLVLLPGAKEAVASFRAAGFATVIVTNQSAIARGLCSKAQYEAVSARLVDLLGPGMIDAIFACPYHPAGRGEFALDHAWRKPSPGMLLDAATLLKLDLAKSVMVGDSQSDIEAGVAAGVGRVIHVLTGHGADQRQSIAAYAAGMSRRSDTTRIELVSAIHELRPEELVQ